MRIPSLPDWAFFTLTPALVIGMIWLALSVGDDRRPLTVEEIRAQGLVFEGAALQAITTGPGLTAQHLAEGDRSFVRINAVRGPFDGEPHGGAFFALDPTQLTALQGHALEFRAIIRASASEGAEGVLLNFFLPDRGQDQWERVELSDEYAGYVKSVRSDLCEWQMGLVSFWPDWEDDAQYIDLERVEVRIVEPLACS